MAVLNEEEQIKAPVSFYTLQKRYIQLISETINNKGILLIEAGTGFGKTLTNLYGVLNVPFIVRPQIIYLSKTHRQNEQVINELERLNNVNPTKIVTGLQMASRKQLCHIEHVASAHHSTAIDLCKKYQDFNSKEFMKEFERCKSCLTDKQKIRLPVVMTVKKLENFAQEYHGCAYLTARELLSEFNVITGHYNYFLNKDIKKAVGMEEEKSILILDEGHNLEEVLTDQYSSILSNYIMQNAQKEVNSVDYQLLSSLNNLNNSIELFISTHGKINEDIHFEGEKMTEYFRSYGINESRLNALESRFYIMKESLLNKQREKLGYFPSSLMTEEVITFFSMKELQPKDVGYIFTKLPKGYRIRKVCLNPALAFTEIRKQSLAIIICSGTLSPLSLWQEILGIEQISKIAKYGTLTDPRRVKIVAFSHDKHNNILTTKYSHRIKRKEIYGDYLQAIAELVTINLDNGGILLFAPSYDFLNSISLPTNYGRVKCFIETQDAKESQNMLDDYVNSIKSGQKALFAGVLGGKLSEGMDLPQELVRMVVIIGIPYPPPNDPVIQLKRHYYDENIRKGLGNDWYNAQAYRKVSQALGRGWRTTNDYSIGILLDNRFTFTSSIDQLPLWIKNNLHLAKDWSDGIRTVNSFFQKVKDLEN